MGDASMMTTQLGVHENFTITECEKADETNRASWLVQGMGSRYFPNTGPDIADTAGYRDMVIQLFHPLLPSVESVVGYGGVSSSCDGSGEISSTLSISDWNDLDLLLEELGKELKSLDLKNTINVKIEAPLHAHDSM